MRTCGEPGSVSIPLVMRCWVGTAVVAFGLAFAAQQSNAGPLEDALGPMVGTLSVEVNPSFAGGSLVACTIDFRVLVRDTIYKQGALVAVSGYLGLAEANNNVVGVLKVSLNDVDASAVGGFKTTAPAGAYLLVGNKTNKENEVGKGPSDPGSLLVIFDLDSTTDAIMDGLAFGEIRIGVSRVPGGVDIPIVVDTSVLSTAADGARKRTDANMARFLTCATALFKAQK